MEKLYPGLLAAMGPATDEGFYFDFDYSGKISEIDFPKIEAEMAKIISSNLPITRKVISVSEAKKMFSHNPYKLEWLTEIEKRGQKSIIYSTGKEFTDLCAGPHVKSTGKIGPFKLLSVAGAYWHGDEKNKMLTRIYGTCFPTREELDHHLWQMDEAVKRDHRKLGEALDLFTIDEEVGQGLVLWLPKGTIIRDELEKWAKDTEAKWGYQRVSTPNITKSGLYFTSGHLPYYKKDMYPPMVLDDKEEYYLKPMNCPHHHRIFASRPRSYKDLPLRLAEYAICYRYESSGELYGLMRVRGFTQNDAHIYCTEEQAVSEFLEVMKLHEYYYQTLGIKEYHLELSLRDPKNKSKYHGNEEMWKLAEKLTREAVAKTSLKMVEQIGNAAFYGPKIDFIIHSVTGREFAASTNQIDLFMGERFGLKYIDKNGKEKTPVIIHRAPLGSHERFIGFLIEHYAGAFPLWLTPVQIILIPIADRHKEYADRILELLVKENIRAEVDSRSESMQAKIRDATLQKIPFMGIMGDKEVQSSKFKVQSYKEIKLSVRTREGKDLGIINLTQLIDKLKVEIQTKS
jgi:threonyl-tRNA synthetase